MLHVTTDTKVSRRQQVHAVWDDHENLVFAAKTMQELLLWLYNRDITEVVVHDGADRWLWKIDALGADEPAISERADAFNEALRMAAPEFYVLAKRLLKRLTGETRPATLQDLQPIFAEVAKLVKRVDDAASKRSRA